jgi:hypothetical protein
MARKSAGAANPPICLPRERRLFGFLSRRFISSMGDFLPYALSAPPLGSPVRTAFRPLTLLQSRRQVLGAD